MNSRQKNLLLLAGLLIFLYCLLSIIQNIQKIRGKAVDTSSVTTVDGASPQSYSPIWRNFAQGGEEQTKMIAPVRNEVAGLNPAYIRIDHIYDFNNVVTGAGSYQWLLLDEKVQEILDAGAIPFLSLSYMPPAFAADGLVTSKPTSYQNWQNLVQATIERYSGKEGKNIPYIYYEVWNEPDLFGKMSPYDYFQLYQSSANGAAAARNTAPFKLGGPAIIGANRTWMNTFLGLVANAGTRLDFVSWHSYGQNPQKINLEAATVNGLANFRYFGNRVEKIVTEWGSDSEMSSNHDGNFDASHTLAAVTKTLGSVNGLFAFELKDGPNPQGKKYWGRWGLLTHEKFGVTKKPRYYAFTLLNQLRKYLLPVSEDPSSYTLASTDGKGNYVLLSTFFPYQGQGGNRYLSLNIKNFLPGEFEETVSYLGSAPSLLPPKGKFISLGTNWGKNLSLSSFSTVSISLKRLTAATTKAKGFTADPADLSAHLVSPLPPLIYPLFANLADSQETGEISFHIKPFWNGSDINEYYFFETRFSPSIKFFAYKKAAENSLSQLVLVFEYNNSQKQIALDISDWKNTSWYKVSFSWDNPKMEIRLKVDNLEKKETIGVVNPVTLGKFILVGSDFDAGRQINADLDNLEIKINNQTLFYETFDTLPQ